MLIFVNIFHRKITLAVNKKSRRERLESLKNEERTMIFHEAPHRLRATLADMAEVLGDRPIALCREITKLHEETMRCTVGEAIAHYEEHSPRGEYVLVLEGKSLEEKRQEEISSWENMSIEEHMAYYENQGMDEKTAMKQVAKDRGVGKREIYQYLHVD